MLLLVHPHIYRFFIWNFGYQEHYKWYDSVHTAL